ncbi:hypothetical protein [Nocardia carnea]|uniref:hypothetical protein n=1 Tax=Nocardia carnea TaxID=37328 RepID=UPI002455F2B2|nr:hypothetical protein [Nocardia carnea]
MYPGQQPSSRPAPGYYGQPAAEPIEVVFVSDNSTARTLSRVTALMTWRLRATWIFIAVLPVLLMIGGILRLLAGGSDTDFDIVEMFGAFFVVLSFELAVFALFTLWTMVRGNANVRRFARSGTQMWVRYTHNAMYLRLPQTVDIDLPYTGIKRADVFRNVVYLRLSNGKGLPLPRALAPKAALALMRDGGVHA